jgi:Immunity protein 26
VNDRRYRARAARGKLTSRQSRKKQPWRDGDVFGVSLPDGRFCLGQVLGQMGDYTNVVNCAFFDIQFDASAPPPLDLHRLIAVLSTTRDLLDGGYWMVVGHAPVCIPKRNWPNEQFARHDYVGSKTYGSGNVKYFLEAFYGFEPWDAYHDQNYFDKLLISPLKKPPNEKLKFAKPNDAE